MRNEVLALTHPCPSDTPSLSQDLGEGGGWGEGEGKKRARTK
jgi:hypothetical protein